MDILLTWDKHDPGVMSHPAVNGRACVLCWPSHGLPRSGMPSPGQRTPKLHCSLPGCTGIKSADVNFAVASMKIMCCVSVCSNATLWSSWVHEAGLRVAAYSGQ